MPNQNLSEKAEPYNRRLLLKMGLASVGLTGASFVLSSLWQKQKTKVKRPKQIRLHIVRDEIIAESEITQRFVCQRSHQRTCQFGI